MRQPDSERELIERDGEMERAREARERRREHADEQLGEMPKCWNCGKPFQDGELYTHARDEDGTRRTVHIDDCEPAIPVLAPITVRPVALTAPEFQPKPGETECVECGERYTGRMHICPAND